MRNFIAGLILDRISTDMLPATQLIDRLRGDGYVEDFELVDTLLTCRKTCHSYKVTELTVDDVFRFTDDSQILDGLVVYALRDPWEDVKGIFVVH